MKELVKCIASIAYKPLNDNCLFQCMRSSYVFILGYAVQMMHQAYRDFGGHGVSMLCHYLLFLYVHLFYEECKDSLWKLWGSSDARKVALGLCRRERPLMSVLHFHVLYVQDDEDILLFVAVVVFSITLLEMTFHYKFSSSTVQQTGCQMDSKRWLRNTMIMCSTSFIYFRLWCRRPIKAALCQSKRRFGKPGSG